VRTSFCIPLASNCSISNSAKITNFTQLRSRPKSKISNTTFYQLRALTITLENSSILVSCLITLLSPWSKSTANLSLKPKSLTKTSMIQIKNKFKADENKETSNEKTRKSTTKELKNTKKIATTNTKTKLSKQWVAFTAQGMAS
jgi:hypothetical protein